MVLDNVSSSVIPFVIKAHECSMLSLNLRFIEIALSFCLQCDFQAIYASGIKGKAGLSPENLAEDLGPLFESIIRCIPGPRIEDGALQMLVSGYSFYCFLFSFSDVACLDLTWHLIMLQNYITALCWINA